MPNPGTKWQHINARKPAVCGGAGHFGRRGDYWLCWFAAEALEDRQLMQTTCKCVYFLTRHITSRQFAMFSWTFRKDKATIGCLGDDSSADRRIVTDADHFVRCISFKAQSKTAS